MKKLLIIFFAVTLLFCFTACGDKKEDEIYSSSDTTDVSSENPDMSETENNSSSGEENSDGETTIAPERWTNNY